MVARLERGVVPSNDRKPCQAKTKVQHLYTEWKKLTESYRTTEGQWERRELSGEAFETTVDPILDARDEIESQLKANSLINPA